MDTLPPEYGAMVETMFRYRHDIDDEHFTGLEDTLEQQGYDPAILFTDPRVVSLRSAKKCTTKTSHFLAPQVCTS